MVHHVSREVCEVRFAPGFPCFTWPSLNVNKLPHLVSTYLTRAVKGVRMQVTRVKQGALQNGGFTLFSSTVYENLISVPVWLIISAEKSVWSPCRESIYRKKNN